MPGAQMLRAFHLGDHDGVDAGDDCGQSRYKETGHIKTFYEVNRL